MSHKSICGWVSPNPGRSYATATVWGVPSSVKRLRMDAIRWFAVPLKQQIKGLHDALYDAGLSMADQVGASIVSIPAWEDEGMVALSLRHPLLYSARSAADTSPASPWS